MSYDSHCLEREKWLESIYPEYKYQTWHDETVFHPSHIKHFEFFKEEERIEDYISPKKICGIEYAYAYNCPSYHSDNWRLSWIELFHRLKRLNWVMNKFKTRSDVVKHIHENDEPKFVYQFGDHYFTTGGQHRLCLAKFLEVDKIKVNIIRYKFDKDLFKREMELIIYMPKLKKYKLVSKYYKPEFKNDNIFFDTDRITVIVNKKLIKAVVNHYEELHKNPLKGVINFFNAIHTNHKIHIKKEDELYLLDSLFLSLIFKKNMSRIKYKIKTLGNVFT